MTYNEENRFLEFDLRDPFILQEVDSMEYLGSLREGESTFKNEPIEFHLEIIEIFILLSQLGEYDVLKNRLKEIFTINYALKIFCTSDIFIWQDFSYAYKNSLHTPKNKEFEDEASLMQRKAFSFFKMRLTCLMYNLHFRGASASSSISIQNTADIMKVISLENARLGQLEEHIKFLKKEDFTKLFHLAEGSKL